MAFPTLMRPKVLALRNRWRVEQEKRSSYWRDIIVLAFGLVVMTAMFHLSLFALARVDEVSRLVYFSPSIPFSILLLMLFVMLLVSNSLTSLGALFLSKDLELVLSAPISRFRFFVGKVASVLFVSSWMPLVFIAPFLLAYGVWYNAHLVFYLISFIALIPYFLLPVAIAVILSTVFTAIIPPSKARYVGILVIAVFVGFIYLAAEPLGAGLRSRGDISELLRVVSNVSLPDQIWLPSHWVALSLRDAIEGRYGDALCPLYLLYGSALGFLSLAYLTMGFLYDTAYSRSRDSRQQLLLSGRKSWQVLVRWCPWIESPTRGILLKEYRTFFRDMPQVIQLLLLGGVYLVYLYNLRIFRLIESVPLEQRATWQSFIYIINVSMGAFVTTAAATRLVFPSLSLEGKAYWMLQTSPVSLYRVMQIKYWTWFVPIGILSSIVFLSGAVAINVNTFGLWVTFIAGWLLSAGIVGLGIGLGAKFANFDWEHSAQLAASFGSFVFMLSSIALITLNMIPIGFLLFVREPGMIGEFMPQTAWYLVILLCASAVVAVNFLVISWSARVGERALEERRAH